MIDFLQASLESKWKQAKLTQAILEPTALATVYHSLFAIYHVYPRYPSHRHLWYPLFGGS
jgi:hypothetical protein